MAEAAVDMREIVELGAVDAELFNRTFFPKTFRQESPDFHREIDGILDDQSKRFCNIIVFRGGAKTTKLRAYVARRISYNISKTILYIGKSQAHAGRSLRWLRKQVEKNRLWADTFKLTPGDKWTDEELNINHGVEDDKIWLVALGITGSVRGLNFDDYRPDLIVIDDVIDDENAATAEQRLKIENLILGSVKESLAPASEAPESKMVMLQTPLDFDDFSQKSLKDLEFFSVVFPCWTKETKDLPLEFRESAWPARWPSEVVRNEYMAAVARNKLSVFSREKECKLITPETALFRAEWLQYYGEGEETELPPAHEMWIEMAIDPVPPPSEQQIKKGLAKKDFEAFVVAGRYKNRYFVLDSVANRGHEPNWTVMTFFELALRWRPRKIKVEAISYQRTLVWLLKEAMKARGTYFVVEPITDKREKMDRIADGLSGPLSNRAVVFKRTQTNLLEQVTHAPNLAHDDELDALSVVISSLQNSNFAGILGLGGDLEDEDGIEALEYNGGAP